MQKDEITDLFLESMANYTLGDSKKEELNFTDLFFPKINVLFSTKEIMDKIKDKDFSLENGLNIKDYEEVCSIIKTCKESYEKDSSLDNLKMLNEEANKMFLHFIIKKREYIVQNNGSIEAYDESVKDFFSNDSRIFTPCVALEQSLKM